MFAPTGSLGPPAEEAARLGVRVVESDNSIVVDGVVVKPLLTLQEPRPTVTSDTSLTLRKAVVSVVLPPENSMRATVVVRAPLTRFILLVAIN